jgi:hypothetical protein
MITNKSLEDMPKTARLSFLQSCATATQAQVSALPAGGAKNDAVLELNRYNYLLTVAQK